MNNEKPQLHIVHELPSGLLNVRREMLLDILPGPTLIHLPGHHPEPLFVSILLHGNEEVGLLAIQRLLQKYQNRTLPRALSIFVGNVAAASEGQRLLNGQPDYNRIWPGGELPPTPEHGMMAQVTAEMAERRVFASIDLHNNTGLNPHYACVNHIDHRFLQLASLFSRTVVYFQRPRGVQSMAFAELCPAVTCECGKVGDESGVAHAMEFIEACLHLSEIPNHPVPTGDIHVFHTVATLKVPSNVDFSFENPDAPLYFAEGIDHCNFRELPAGTLLARRRADSEAYLEVWDEAGQETREDFLTHGAEEITLRRSLMPAMLTRDEQVIRQDCLCYLMERYPLPK